jgi:hypothetical protein
VACARVSYFLKNIYQKISVGYARSAYYLENIHHIGSPIIVVVDYILLVSGDLDML